MSLRDFLTVLRARWKVIVASILLVVGASAAVTLSMTPIYTAQARFYLSADDTSKKSENRGTYVVTTDDLNTYVAVLGSPAVTVPLRERLGLPRHAHRRQRRGLRQGIHPRRHGAFGRPCPGRGHRERGGPAARRRSRPVLRAAPGDGSRGHCHDRVAGRRPQRAVLARRRPQPAPRCLRGPLPGIGPGVRTPLARHEGAFGCRPEGPVHESGARRPSGRAHAQEGSRRRGRPPRGLRGGDPPAAHQSAVRGRDDRLALVRRDVGRAGRGQDHDSSQPGSGAHQCRRSRAAHRRRPPEPDRGQDNGPRGQCRADHGPARPRVRGGGRAAVG